MKITKIDVFHVKDKENPSIHPILCRVYTDEGIYGDGEAAMAYGVGSTAAFGMVQDLANIVIGMNPLENEKIWDKMYRTTFWGQNGGGVFTAGMSAIDIALWDIKGKYFNVPIYTLLGGKLNDNLRTYASQLQFGWKNTMSGMFTIEDYVGAAKRAINQGYDAIKVDFFTFKENPSEGGFTDKDRTTLLTPKNLKIVVDRVAAVRKAVGPNVDIIMENHSFLDVNSAIQLAEAVKPYNIFYFEEPNTPDPHTAERLAQKIQMPIASGERIYTRWQYAKYFETNSLQIAQPDMGTCGGFTEVKKVCDMAYTYDVAIQIHACGSPISTAASLQMEAAIPNFIIHEHHQCNLVHSHIKLCKYDYQPIDGRFKVPDKPGLGQELSDFVLNDRESVEKVTIDGSTKSWTMA
ncbi:MAG: mandelate racemase/muconate lactonizing enzyme family protein [Clostridia bacterium]|jgi:L-alanine-DL-glutamate epimerase-like enolase superfamily enzyme|nr:mandelate racemase/muconate lactonizing enzyme family protein [Clostridia bacterium]MCI2000565.1 mandelate racemase/muconate lactonizing enzyme family protein [Clostridia bacterium]MCI2015021.1 mandelate racemase/muconate lactonizing enzyme family protein [Clostridia bacterium]